MKARFRIYIICVLLCFLTVACGVHYKQYSDITPVNVGLSSEQLDNITKSLQEDVKNKDIPGAVALIYRKGKIAYLTSIGMQDKNVGKSMSRNSIFRIYSMSKPIVSVAVLILQDEGKLNINDPLAKYIPEFKKMKVGVEIVDEDTGDTKKFYTVPAKRMITIKDLLRHTSGLTYSIFGESRVKSMYKDAGILNKDQTISELTLKISKLPLAYQPGTIWEYSRSTDVLGHLVEVVSGMTLDRFLAGRIFIPLEMKDTGFYVKKDNLDRVAEPDPQIKWFSKPSEPPKTLSGGGGLFSTTDDYLRFALMLFNGGELNGKRILKYKTVKLMTRDHLGSLSNRNDPFYYPGPGYGFGLGVAVRKDKKAWREGSVGDYGWEGIA